MSGPTASIARLPAISEDSPDPDIVALFEKSRREGGQIINLQLMLGHAPKIARACHALAYTIRTETKTSRRLIELAILHTAELIASEYELNQHRPMGIACGITEEQQAALPKWRNSKLFPENERALLAYVEQMVERRGDVDDATFAALARHFDPPQIVELTITIGSYLSTGMFLRALRVKVDPPGRLTSMGLPGRA